MRGLTLWFIVLLVGCADQASCWLDGTYWAHALVPAKPGCWAEFEAEVTFRVEGGQLAEAGRLDGCAMSLERTGQSWEMTTDSADAIAGTVQLAIAGCTASVSADGVRSFDQTTTP